MNDPADWLAFDEALADVLAACEPCGRERVSLAESLGRALAEDVRSRVDHPPWDNSAMDGFAVRAEDVRGAAADRPLKLPISDDIPAGAFPSGPLAPATVARVMTGAPVPEGATGVVRIEHTDGGVGDVVSLFDDSDAQRNIRSRAENLQAGEKIARTGDEVTPALLGLMAIAGIESVETYRPPRVGILANGDELVDFDRFDEVLDGRRIMNSNSYALAAQLRAVGAIPVDLGIARDDPDSLRERMVGLDICDALISSAGVSVGDHDHVKRVLDDLGFRRRFWRVRVRPGSALLFGTLEGRAVWGVPGNPVSAVVAFETLVLPGVRRLAGHSATARRRMWARTSEPIQATEGVRQFLRVRIEPSAGGPQVRLTGPQGSGILASMAAADGLLDVAEETGSIAAGDLVSVLPVRDFVTPMLSADDG